VPKPATTFWAGPLPTFWRLEPVRVLLTRPEPDAARSAALWRAKGHQVVVSPVLRLRATGAPLPPGPFDAIVLTSANALLAFPTGAPPHLAPLPVLCVGDRTAAAARAAGFQAVTSAKGDVAALTELAGRSLPQGARLLYLAGVERKPDLERAWADGTLSVVAVYEAQPASHLTQEAQEALRQGEIDAVLHFSRRSAEVYLALCRDAGLWPQALRPLQFCLSRDVAEAFPVEALKAETPASQDFTGDARIRQPKIRIAATPDEAGLLSLAPEA
jgi:uroporphyrinogen-III synthase